MIRRFVRRLADCPSIFDLLRWILEGGYRGHKSVIQQELTPVGQRILDIGCGTGFYSRFFDAAVYVGVDISPIYISAAQQKYPANQFIVGDGTALPFADSEFETAMISGVLHHLSDDEAQHVLAEASRILSAEGKLVVWEDIPAPAWWNVIGHVIHRLDLGQYIRKPSAYRTLLEHHFIIRSERTMRSGFMDYVIFACSPRKG